MNDFIEFQMPGIQRRPYVTRQRTRAWLCAIVCLSAACSRSPASTGGYDRAAQAPALESKLFTRMPAAYTGVRFENRFRESVDTNVFIYRNYYNGGGVAIGDLNGDGLPELVLTSNQGGARLYLNEGKFRFRDITAQAGIAAQSVWTTGVTMADVDGDGRLDLYISHAGQTEPARRANALWINKGAGQDSIPHFDEKGAAFGVADQGYTTQGAFFDYDRDGDLDLFVINNSPRPVSSFGPRNTRNERDPYGGHKLYRNDGGHFVDVSEKAGVFGSEIGFGLGVGVGDVNRDGWPDIYASNDFFEQDYLYINKKDGTFAESLKQQMVVSSYFSMGMDIGDLNNDGWPDVYTTDMLPEDEYRLRTMSMFEGWDVYQAKVRDDYGYQLMRDMLQRNNGNGTFTDVGQMAGVANTDWSWSALIADLDLDGRKDIFVTNGLVRDVTSQDYIAFLANDVTMKDATKSGKVDFMKLIQAMPSTPLSNYAFHNLGDLSFKNESASWGLDAPSFSSGASYGDLDGDGALDLVVNNVDGEAFVYRNNARSIQGANHYLQVRLEGSGGNRFAVGARVALTLGSETLTQELFPTRGFQSSVDYVLGFGLGTHDVVDLVRVDWPDGRRSEVRAVKADQRLTIGQASATPVPAGGPNAPTPVVAEMTAGDTLPFAHKENDFVDFDRERLIPKLLSTEGPMMAVGDVNGDKLDDIFIGGAKEQAGALLIQQPNGSFARSNAGVFDDDAISEDLGAVFFDADGDGDADLYVVSGGNEYSDMSPALQDRLYLNNGGGRFTKSVDRLPAETVSGSRVVSADYDGDGDLDLFVGGRIVPWRYGEDAASLLLRNDGHGHFSNDTEQLAPDLAKVGMVTDALWQDVDSDGRQDLIVVGEWMPITIFHNAGGGRLTRATAPGLDKSNGWWNRIVAGDFDGDGRMDFAVGNLGLNTRLHASATEPVNLLVKDFDGNSVMDQIVSYYSKGRRYPLVLRDELMRAIPPLKARFPSYTDYAKASVDDIFSAKDREGAIDKSAYTFATAVVHNDGGGAFTLTSLPAEAQLAPVYGMLARDVDGDGAMDLLLGGNFDGFKPEIGRSSESRGLLLRGDGKGRFTPVGSAASGFVVTGQTRDIQAVRTGTGDLMVVARNNDTPLTFRAKGRRIVTATTNRKGR